MAQSILATDNEFLDITTRKVKQLLRPELMRAASNGVADPVLFAMSSGLRELAKSDVRQNEGMNSLIRTLCQRCRHIGMPLLSARTTIKKEIGVGMRGACTRWRDIRDKAAQVLEDSISHYSDAHAGVLCDTARWDCPPPSGDLPSSDILLRTYKRLNPSPHSADAMIWANRMSLTLSSHFPHPTARACVSCRPFRDEIHSSLRVDELAYLCSEKSYQQLWLTTCKVHRRGDALIVKHVMPRQVISAYSLFAQLYETHAPTAGNCVAVDSHRLAWTQDVGTVFAHVATDGTTRLFEHAIQQLLRPVRKTKEGGGGGDMGGAAPSSAMAPPVTDVSGDTHGDVYDVGDDWDVDDEVVDALGVALFGNGAGGDDELADEYDAHVEKDQRASCEREALASEAERTKASSSSASSKELPTRVADEGRLGHMDMDDVQHEADMHHAAFAEFAAPDGAFAGPTTRAAGGSDPDDMRILLATWKSSAMEGLGILGERDAAMASTSVGGEWPWQFSLVAVVDDVNDACHHSVTLVAWTSPTLWLGRRAKLVDGHVMSIVPARVREERFDDPLKATLVHPAIDLRPQRVQKAARPQIPPRALRLKTMWEMAQGAGSGDPLASMDPCMVCGSVQVGDDADACVVYSCALCMTAAHEVCAQTFLKGCAECIGGLPAVKFELPNVFLRTDDAGRQVTSLCCLCRELVRRDRASDATRQ